MDEELLHKRLYYPRVSEVYQMYTSLNFAYVNPHVLRNAQERGTRVHVYCTAYVKGYAWAKEIDPECSPYVESFIQWYKKEVEKIILLPTRLYDDNEEFSGEPDFIFKLKNRIEPVLIDLKTPESIQKSWVVQLAAYIKLLEANGYQIRHATNLRLRESGSYPLIKHYNEDELNQGKKIFANSLENYNYFIRKKYKSLQDAVN